MALKLQEVGHLAHYPNRAVISPRQPVSKPWIALLSRNTTPQHAHVARNPLKDALMAHASARTQSARPMSALHKRQLIPLFAVLIVAVVLLLLPCGICILELLLPLPC